MVFPEQPFLGGESVQGLERAHIPHVSMPEQASFERGSSSLASRSCVVAFPASGFPGAAAAEHSLLPSSAKPARGGVEQMREAASQTDSLESEQDERLVLLAQQGSAAAFDSLVERHTSKLYGLVFHMTGNHDDTNDLLQDVWTKVFRSLAGFRGASRFTTWVHSITVNMTINFLKKRARRQAISLDAAALEEDGADPTEGLLVSAHTPRSEASRGELQQRLSEALAKLTPEHRAVVTMFDIQGMAHAEISKVLGVSEGTVRSRLFYAHRQLQSYLSDFHTQESGT